MDMYSISGQSGSKSKQFNKSQNQYLGNLGGFANQAAQTSQDALGTLTPALADFSERAKYLSNPDQAQREQARYDQVMGAAQQTLGGILSQPGYSAEQQRGMRLATTAPITSAYGTAMYQNSAGARMNGNAAGATAANAALARERSRAITTGLGGLQQKFADADIAGRQFGAQFANQLAGTTLAQNTNQQNALGLFQFPSNVMSNVYSQNLNAQNEALGQQGQAVGMYQQRAAQPGFLKQAALAGLGGLSSAATMKYLPKG